MPEITIQIDNQNENYFNQKWCMFLGDFLSNCLKSLKTVISLPILFEKFCVY